MSFPYCQLKHSRGWAKFTWPILITWNSWPQDYEARRVLEKVNIHEMLFSA